MLGMSVLAMGLNHTTAAVDLRGKFAFALDQLAPALKTLHSKVSGEAALLSTCNRTELYCAAPALTGQGLHLRKHAVEWLANVGQVSPDELMRHTYVLEGQAAARHAFRVASGLDSMV